jgi:hypothetical protein
MVQRSAERQSGCLSLVLLLSGVRHSANAGDFAFEPPTRSPNSPGAATLARRMHLTCGVRQDASDPRSHPAARASGRPRRGLTLAQARRCMAPYDPSRAVASRGRTKGSHLASSQGQVGPFFFVLVPVEHRGAWPTDRASTHAVRSSVRTVMRSRWRRAVPVASATRRAPCPIVVHASCE